jgi:hypothetical protein
LIFVGPAFSKFPRMNGQKLPAAVLMHGGRHNRSCCKRVSLVLKLNTI